MNEIAICNCGAPLVWTFAFSGAEYFCVECGRTYGMLGVDRAEETPELKKRLTRNERKWASIREGLITGGARRIDCETCDQKNEQHLNHATPEELKAHETALKKIDELLETNTAH